jgi:acetyl-CoA synthetase
MWTIGNLTRRANSFISESMHHDIAWTSSPEIVCTSNITWLMQQVGVSTYDELHAWSARQRAEYWRMAIERLGVRLRRPFEQMLDVSSGVDRARWLVGAELNIAESCFAAPAESPAVIDQAEGRPLRTTTVGELDRLSNRVANALHRRGICPGDAVATALPLTAEAVAAYLGIVKAGAVAVAIAESFSPAEIAVRLRIGRAKLIFTQDVVVRGGKQHELYARVKSIDAPPAVVLPARDQVGVPRRDGDVAWRDFLADDEAFTAVPRSTTDPLNVLFSSGTTGEPKAIPWTHLCPIKCAADAHFHQDVHPGDVLAWPTSLGWMMGPWLIFASLMNRATMALYAGAPTDRRFARFVEQAKVTMLGIVPSLVSTWRTSGCLEGSDWRGIRLFSSTGECSNPDDMRWLMAQAGGRPIMEYCGGTEIAGGYITGTVVQPCVPSTFTSPTLGLDFVILDAEDRPADKGELFLIPPSIGFSTELLNADHHAIYYAGCPRGPQGQMLRRHGDEMERLPGGLLRAHGRVDDTMNLGGIKVSAAEIERVVNRVAGVRETAAVAEPPPHGGPSLLVIYAVLSQERPKEQLQAEMQDAIRRELNPLFKIHRVAVVEALPRTASNKVMRRMLRGFGGEHAA